MSVQKGSIGSDIKSLRPDIHQMNVSAIAIRTNKTERVVRAYLTRHGLSCEDYDGAARKSANLMRTTVSFNENGIRKNSDLSKSSLEPQIATEKKEERSFAENNSIAKQVLEENKQKSDSTFEMVSISFGLIWFILTVIGFKEGGAAFFLLWLLMSFGFFMASMMTWSWISDKSDKARINLLSDEERKSYDTVKNSIRAAQDERIDRASKIMMYGLPNISLICPHCHSKGNVRSKSAEEITSTKVIPIIGNNIKARKKVTQMHCDQCGVTWNI
jgi:hypothetical protein